MAKGIEIREAHFPGRAPIDAYGNGGFRFADMSHRGSILCLPSGIHGWDKTEEAPLTLADLERVLDEAGEIEVLLVSSLTTHRWIMPKGWPKDGRSGAETALEEAWEEAGIRIIGEPPVHIGRYAYHKRLRGDVPVRTLVSFGGH